MITEIFVIVKGFYLIQLFFLFFDAHWSHVLNWTFNWHFERHSKSYWIFQLVRLTTEKTSFQYLLKLSQDKSTFYIAFWNFNGLVYFLTFKIFITARSNHQRYSIGVLRIFAKFTRKHLHQNVFINKVAGLRLFLQLLPQSTPSWMWQQP